MNNDLISRQVAIRFIREKVSLSLFMKRSVDKADKACVELCEMLKRELPSAQIQWIPCSERLPEKDGRYLVTCTKCGAWTVDLNIWHNDPKPSWLWEQSVIAWLPLPEPYEADKEDQHG